jgi:hypothetical protein
VAPGRAYRAGVGILGHRDFRRVWLAATASATGDAASWIALVALALGPAHASVAVLAVCYTAPVAVGGLAAGWALDRFDRRRVIAADGALRGVVFASVPVAALAGTPSAALLYAVAAVYGLLKMVSLAGFPALIPRLVPEADVTRANALEGAAYGLASLCGAGLGGVVVGRFGATGAVWLIAADVLSYLAFAAAVATTRAAGGPPAPRPAGGGSGAGLGVAIRLAWSNRLLRDTTAMFALFNIGEGVLLVFLPHRAVALGLGPGGYGDLVAAATGGELLAAALLARFGWPYPLVPSILVAQLVAAGAAGLLLAGGAAGTVLAMVALGTATAPMTAWAQTLRMRAVPAGMHGRLFALLRTVMQGTPPLGALLAAGLSGFGPAVTVGFVVAAMGVPALACAPGLLRDAGAARAPAQVCVPSLPEPGPPPPPPPPP